ncbi:MAG TPA: hypothetical protein VHU84_10420, partial [Lacipirellulaceae bacterium]|nr:hypothetical protein [Lacipirellulaceae bacterium]
MTDNILKHYAERVAPSPTPKENETDGTDDLGCYGFLRGVRDRSIMLQLFKKSGGVNAFGYSWLEQIEYDASTGLILHFGGHAIKIIGRNLNAEVRPNVRLVDALCRHRVP